MDWKTKTLITRFFTPVKFASLSRADFTSSISTVTGLPFNIARPTTQFPSVVCPYNSVQKLLTIHFLRVWLSTVLQTIVCNKSDKAMPDWALDVR
jgi:hypothetical protein